jgi:septal ring factor EnvC (AmiA/AmiB activator)
MNSKTSSFLKFGLPFCLLAICIGTLAFLAHERVAKAEARIASLEEKLGSTVEQLSKTRSELKKSEILITQMDLNYSNVRGELLRMQRKSSDHESMLATMFKIEKSGDSAVGFRNQEGKLFSIGVSR